MISFQMTQPRAKTNLAPYKSPLVESETTNLIRVRSTFGEVAELSAPVIGRDFVAGFIADTDLFQLIRKELISSINLEHRDYLNSVNLEWSRRSAGEYLNRLSTPTDVHMILANNPGSEFKAWLTGIYRGWLFFDSGFSAVPISSIARLTVSGKGAK